MKLLIATRNQHKLAEIREIFSDSGLELLTVDDFSDLPEVEEDADTFALNAIKKAVTLAMIAKVWTLADDSGLEVDALGGEPGVYSARYAGEPVDYKANNRKLLKEMKGVVDRNARFRCVIALSTPEGLSQYVEGVCEGIIVNDERGEEGFGYDPLFMPDGYEDTFAEMDAGLKNSISHRANALRIAWEKWEKLLK
jgi:XTP/dITP diphosphohydrolase